MRVLLDEHLPLDLAKELVGHEVSTVRAQGWTGMTNGVLLTTAAAGGFQVLVTNDRGIERQQNLGELSLGVVVLDAPSNKLRDLMPRIPATLAAIAAAVPGEVRHVAG